MARIERLSQVVEGGLCTGCGICESLAGRARIAMALSQGGQIRPQIKTDLDSAEEWRILAICPGATLVGPAVGDGFGFGPIDPVWGPMEASYRAWAAKPEIRHRAAAGGTLTALGAYLIASGEVEAVLHVKASADRPELTDAWVSRSVEEVVAGAQSRYGPAAPLVHVKTLLDRGTRFAVIGKPCDISAIRHWSRSEPRVAEQIPYLLTIFCGGVPTVQTAHKIAAYYGVAPEELSLFRWRGEGWPGVTRIETKDGRGFDLAYDDAWYNPAMPWDYDIQFRCKICPDAIGEMADVAAPDGWIMENGKPIHREAPGVNIAIARTAKGKALIGRAVAAGWLATEPFTRDEIHAMHQDHLRRKYGHPARGAALALLGQPRLATSNYRAGAMLWRNGLIGNLREFFGMIRRVIGGRNREPVG